MAVIYDINSFGEAAVQASRQLEQCLGTWHDTLNLQQIIGKVHAGAASQEALEQFGQQLGAIKKGKEDEIRELVRNSVLLDPC